MKEHEIVLSYLSHVSKDAAKLIQEFFENRSLIQESLRNLEKDKTDPIKVALLGESGASKSSLVNYLLQCKKAKVGHMKKGTYDIETYAIKPQHLPIPMRKHFPAGLLVTDTVGTSNTEDVFPDLQREITQNTSKTDRYDMIWVFLHKSRLLENAEAFLNSTDVPKIPILYIMPCWDEVNSSTWETVYSLFEEKKQEKQLVRLASFPLDVPRICPGCAGEVVSEQSHRVSVHKCNKLTHDHFGQILGYPENSNRCAGCLQELFQNKLCTNVECKYHNKPFFHVDTYPDCASRPSLIKFWKCANAECEYGKKLYQQWDPYGSSELLEKAHTILQSSNKERFSEAMILDFNKKLSDSLKYFNTVPPLRTSNYKITASEVTTKMASIWLGISDQPDVMGKYIS